MNKIGFISDIHGNYEALKSVLTKLDNLNITEIYCLGDIVGYFSQVNECCDELRNRKIPCIMGNHDWYLSSGTKCLRSQSVNDCIEYQAKIITQENLNWLRSFPVQRFKDDIHMVHGGWNNPIDEYIEPSEDYFKNLSGNIFVSGHTHIQSLINFGNKTYCNPGSVGMPRDNNPKSAFAVYDGQFHLFRTEYNMQKVFDLMDKAGFNDYYYGCLKSGAKNLCRLN